MNRGYVRLKKIPRSNTHLLNFYNFCSKFRPNYEFNAFCFLADI